MEKKNYNFSNPDSVFITVMGQEVEVRPFLNVNEQIALINQYLETYFSLETKSIEKDAWAEWDAEYALQLGIVDLLSDIKIEGAFDNLFYSNGYQEIENVIVNYWQFRQLLDDAVENIKRQLEMQNSVGAKLDSLFNKIEVLLNNLNNSMQNMNPEMLEKLKETGTELVGKLTENPLVQEVYKDMNKK
jgi:hypothetical protein